MRPGRPRQTVVSHAGARCALALVALLVMPAPAMAASGQGTGDAVGYAGSRACAGCHTYIYNGWRTTRHSHSVKTAQQARQAGYPLPRERRGGQPLSVHEWSDISYVIGGRQRIAYADQAGRIQDTSFHHRVARWDVFPELPMTACMQCHYTGVGSGPEHPQNRAVPGRWVERNIGCEACHGPGARHVETLEKSDIRKDPSSRVCGQCHTAVGKILPKGELHDTHDLVQNWNRDPHVTSVRNHSYTAFCATCHSPYDAHVSDSGDGANRKVFAEDKSNITCIGCHDPHATTNRAYQPGSVSLQPPLAVRSHTFEGNDADFTTTDHREWDDAAQACVRCHRGADRVDLDHAAASCVDCHNTYNRNHSRESRQFHDANQPRLSCRGCHEDATHLMSILYRDPDFLDPKHIHNLRTLPEAVRARYGFRYPRLRAPRTVAAIAASPVQAAPKSRPRKAVKPADEHRHADLQAILNREPHLFLARDEGVRLLRDALLAAPGSTDRHLRLAQSYATKSEFAAALELVERAAGLDSSRMLLELPFTRNLAPDVDDEAALQEITERVTTLLPAAVLPDDAAVRVWLRAHLAMTQGRFALAAQFLDVAQRSAAADLQRALAVLGQADYRRAHSLLEANVKAYPQHHASQAALGFLHLARRRTAPAIVALERAIVLAPDAGSARLLLGHARLRNSDLVGAVQAYRDAIDLEPALLQARFAAAQVYQIGGRPDFAAREYRSIIEREPGLFEARIALANVLKLLSDRIAFQLENERESNPPATVSGAQWRAKLSVWERQLGEYRNLALVELAAATRIRPSALHAYRQVAEIYRRSGRLREAERFYEWLAQREPQIWMHGYRLGTIRIAQGRHAQAVATLRQVIARAPTDGDSWLALGLAMLRDGQLDEAITTFEQASKYEPFNPGLYTNLGAAYATRGDLERAQVALERSLRLHSFPLPRVHLTETNLALVHLHAGRREDAIIALRRALHRYADYALARGLLQRLTSSAQPLDKASWPPFVYNGWLERFGEVTTVGLVDE